jgi:hypothetical protein
MDWLVMILLIKPWIMILYDIANEAATTQKVISHAISFCTVGLLSLTTSRLKTKRSTHTAKTHPMAPYRNCVRGSGGADCAEPRYATNAHAIINFLFIPAHYPFL